MVYGPYWRAPGKTTRGIRVLESVLERTKERKMKKLAQEERILSQNCKEPRKAKGSKRKNGAQDQASAARIGGNLGQQEQETSS